MYVPSVEYARMCFLIMDGLYDCSTTILKAGFTFVIFCMRDCGWASMGKQLPKFDQSSFSDPITFTQSGAIPTIIDSVRVTRFGPWVNKVASQEKMNGAIIWVKLVRHFSEIFLLYGPQISAHILTYMYLLCIKY